MFLINTRFLLQTWHKVFHSLEICVPRTRCANFRAMKNCCLAMLLIFSLVFFVPFNAYASEPGFVDVYASSSGYIACNATISNGRVIGSLSFSNVVLERPYAWLQERAGGRTPVNNNISFGIRLRPYAETQYGTQMIRYNGTLYEFTGNNFGGRSEGIIYPSSTPSQSFAFEFPKTGQLPTTIDLSYPSNNVENFGQDMFNPIMFYKPGTSDVQSFNFSSAKYVSSSGQHLPSNVGQVQVLYSYLIRLKASYFASNADIIQAIDSLNSTVDSGFDRVDSAISSQTSAVTQNQDKNTQKILDQNSQFRQEDRKEAQSVGKIAQDFLSDNTAKVRSNFNILWEPIAFTQRVISIFSSGTRSPSYARRYDGVVGFSYNEQTGCLDPVIDISPRARYGKASSGTSITFPAYTLPVLNLKLWDSFTFDISTIKSSFPALFNAIYVFSGVLCLYWFLGFLSDKFEEVFKE